MTRAAPFIPALLVASLAFGCPANEPPAPSKVAAAPEAEAAPAEPAAVAGEGVPKITSDAAVHQFGAIKATDSIEHVFKIRNAGTADLKIERVQKT